MRIISSTALIVAAAILSASPAHAYKVQISEDSHLNIDLLLQVHAQSAEKAAPDGESWSSEFFLRRARILLFGDLSRHVSFFFDTEQANFGKNGDWAAPFFVQDAFVTLKLRDELMVDAGMILLPLTRHSFTGAVGLNGLDYHAAVIKYPDGSTKIWRDIGVQARGYVLDKTLQYRLGVFAGSQGVVLQKDAANTAIAKSNPQDLPRIAGHVRYAILGSEPDFFFKGIYFAQEPIVSVGVGADYVPDSVLRRPAVVDAGNVISAAEIGDHLAVAGDVFVDYPLDAENELIFQGAVILYRDGPDNPGSGRAFLTELGFRHGSIEPVLSCDYFGSEAPAADYLGFRGGLNYWIQKHAASIKIDFGLEKRGDLAATDFGKTVTAQTQLFF